jgi:hypothetical protein
MQEINWPKLEKYLEQTANDFLTSTGTTLTVECIGMNQPPYSANYYKSFNFTLTNGKGTISTIYYQSLHDAELNIKPPAYVLLAYFSYSQEPERLAKIFNKNQLSKLKKLH